MDRDPAVPLVAIQQATSIKYLPKSALPIEEVSENALPNAHMFASVSYAFPKWNSIHFCLCKGGGRKTVKEIK